MEECKTSFCCMVQMDNGDSPSFGSGPPKRVGAICDPDNAQTENLSCKTARCNRRYSWKFRSGRLLLDLRLRLLGLVAKVEVVGGLRIVLIIVVGGVVLLVVVN